MYRNCLFVSAHIALITIFLFSGCTRNSSEAPQSPPAGYAVRTVPIDASSTGAIRGNVKFTGAAPPRAEVDMTMDPACGFANKGPQLAESVIVNQGELQNVFVYVKDGLGKYIIPKASQPVVLDQLGCRYRPHVLGMVAGQTLRILNSDNTEHNVHPVPQNNPQWNESQMPHGEPKERTFTNPELMLPITCNQHPWMKMYVNVVANPFFAVSDAQGKFEISGLPPGDYTIEAVHEKLGKQETKITVAPKQIANASFSFSAPH